MMYDCDNLLDDNDCPDIGAYHYIRSTKRKDHLVGWNNHYFDTISAQWFEETKFAFTCWRDEKYLSEADYMDIDDCNHRHSDAYVKESCTDITYGESEEVYESLHVFLFEKDGTKERSSSITLYVIPRRNLEKYNAALRQWHRTGIFTFGDKRIDTNVLPWEVSRW